MKSSQKDQGQSTTSPMNVFQKLRGIMAFYLYLNKNGAWSCFEDERDILEHQNTDSILIEERTLTESWIMSMKSPKTLTREYVVLLRNTLLLMFSPKWLYCKNQI
ncbi:hypothetical protein CEXT_167031 [Caerostris extrusa]|uniref:Uncharacterized protein n=1 Tax=Caerostris extrusa TaxID=172846 RepID=A0AAV4T4P0_CAEEX|nr:hypothetical protein CEXT_167031 [Caerostris extrusa]